MNRSDYKRNEFWAVGSTKEIAKKDFDKLKKQFFPPSPNELIINGTFEVRRQIGIDCVSLLEGDAEVPSIESGYIENHTFYELIHSLDTEREKFVAICLYNGFDKKDIAFMLNVHPSRISRNTQAIRKKLSAYLSSIARK